MIIPENIEPVREYSVDDESIKHIIHEIKNDEGFQDYISRITNLLESVELQKVNSVINYLLYGMIINDGLNLENISNIHPDLENYMEGYLTGLSKVEKAISETDKIDVDSMPQLVDCLRMDEEFYGKHKETIDSYIDMLPDIRKNIECIVKGIMGMK